MALIDFPASPSLNDEYTFEGRTWLWNGTGWEVKSFVAPPGATGATGATGPVGVTGATGATPAVGGSNTQVLFNDGGAIGGDAGLTYDKTTDALTAAGSVTAASLIPSGATVPGNGLYLPAANTVALSTGTTEHLRIDSSGALLVGTSTGAALVHIGNSTDNLCMDRNETVTGGPNATFRKSRGTAGAPTIVNDGDLTGALQFRSYDGATYITNARIRAEVDGTPGLNDMPGRLVFSTTADGSATPTERMRIDSTGFISLGGDTNTGFSNPSADNLAFTTNGSERARIDSSGRLLVGATAIPAGNFGGFGNSFIQVLNSSSIASYAALSTTNDIFGSNLFLGKARNASAGIVQNGDIVGQIVFAAADGVDHASTAGLISCRIDGTPGADDTPGRLVFSTTADGASSPTERLRIDSSGRVGIGTSSPNSLVELADAGNITVGTGTGTKIGTATTQKLGFYNATPVVQPAAVADATDAASVITQLNALLARMRSLGLIAT